MGLSVRIIGWIYAVSLMMIWPFWPVIASENPQPLIGFSLVIAVLCFVLGVVLVLPFHKVNSYKLRMIAMVVVASIFMVALFLIFINTPDLSTILTNDIYGYTRLSYIIILVVTLIWRFRDIDL